MDNVISIKRDVIRISKDVRDLKGQGTEYLIDSENNVIAKFQDGNFETAALILGNTEITLKAA